MTNCIEHFPDFKVDNVSGLIGTVLRNEQVLYVDSEENKVKGMCLARVVEFDIAKVLQINCCAGEMESDWFENFLPTIIEDFSPCEISHVEIIGRPGWKPHLKRLGFQPLQVQFVRRLK